MISCYVTSPPRDGSWQGPREELRTGRKKLVRRTFVEEKVFVATYKDTDAATLFGPQVTEPLNPHEPSELTSGYWVMGDFCSNVPGHHLFEDYADVAVTLSRVHEDGSMVLQDGQAQEKYLALKADRDADAKKAADASAATPIATEKGGAKRMLALFASITKGELAEEAPPAQAADAQDPAESDESDSEEPASVSLFARPKPKSAKTGAANKAVATPTKPVSGATPMLAAFGFTPTGAGRTAAADASAGPASPPAAGNGADGQPLPNRLMHEFLARGPN